MNLHAMLNTHPAVRGDADELAVRVTEASIARKHALPAPTRVWPKNRSMTCARGA